MSVPLCVCVWKGEKESSILNERNVFVSVAGVLLTPEPAGEGWHGDSEKTGGDGRDKCGFRLAGRPGWGRERERITGRIWFTCVRLLHLSMCILHVLSLVSHCLLLLLFFF